MPRHLLVIYHSQSGNTAAMGAAIVRGARHPDINGVEVRVRRPFAAGVEDLVWADALVLGTPENFGTMSGALKDFFDRTYYPLQGKIEGLAYAVFVKGGNDGTGALRDVRRIARGYPLREVQEPVVCGGPLTPDVLSSCEELGALMAAGLELGMY